MKKLLILVFVLILVAGCSFEVKKTESVETGITSFEVITDEENDKAVAEEAIADEVEQEDSSDEETTSEEVSTNLTIEDTATEEDQKSAVRITEDYLREKNKLIEDTNTFVQYDGTIGDYILVRHSTLVDGHSSTNGRYAVELMSGEVTDVTNAEDFDQLFNQNS